MKREEDGTLIVFPGATPYFRAMKHYHVTIERDDEAGVWVATSDDIPGLVSEAATIDELVQRVMAVAPELIEDNLPAGTGADELLDICVSSSFTLARTAAH
ncbi:DUF1902 domain-containing protein [Phyllobacterium sp. 0TCS1.6C]|uniref:DUF1902 domain-containing protein n=1 Tax=unclassified Phyllobacterium TaxID=2638441 RepID=UPI0022651593|nr:MULTISPECIES: DUF1902 domain-containing protein [unclassified Phyllobacterium]MCX8281964.1 DUF1902 domain-containing protein [Phyllobacterium sp. 0TCS1.6C]MCX8294427.1 DUF1902 domain-containing protein [Phyllobacterium sp. 0TCS1.6A]